MKKCKTIYLQDPRIKSKNFDIVWAPNHDSIRGPNVINTVKSPNRLNEKLLNYHYGRWHDTFINFKRPIVGFLIGGKIVDILDPEEQSELNNAVSQTLTKNPDNVSRKWNSQKNLDTNAEIIPLNSYQIDQNTCRDFTKTVNKGDKQFQEKSTACRDEKGNWRII